MTATSPAETAGPTAGRVLGRKMDSPFSFCGGRGVGRTTQLSWRYLLIPVCFRRSDYRRQGDR